MDYWSFWKCQRYGRKSWETFQGSLIVKCFFYKHMKRRNDTFSFLFKFLSFNCPALPNATQPDCSITNLTFCFFWFPLFGFYSGEKLIDKNFFVGVNFSQVKLFVEEKYCSPLISWSFFTVFFFFFTDNVVYF